MAEKYNFDLISFGMRLKEIRNFNHKTQEEVAESLNVSVKSIQNWENGIKLPNVDNIISLANLYGMKAGDILEDEAYRVYNKRHSNRIRVIETFEIPKKIETYIEIVEDTFYDNYQIWVFDAFARQKLMHCSMSKLVPYKEIKEYSLKYSDKIVKEYREWLLSILTDSEIDIQIRTTIEDKINLETAGMSSPGCIYSCGKIICFGKDSD